MVYEAIVATLNEMGIAIEQIAPESHLNSDLELDSTEVVQIELEMKRRFGVEVKLQAADDLTVQETCRLVQGRLAEVRSTA